MPPTFSTESSAPIRSLATATAGREKKLSRDMTSTRSALSWRHRPGMSATRLKCESSAGALSGTIKPPAHLLLRAGLMREQAMRIAHVAPLYESVPPKFYGGTERIIHFLTEALVELGHEVT